MRSFNKTLVLIIAEGAFSGRFPVAPGTAGTIVGVLVYLALREFSAGWYAAASIFLILIGTWTAGRAELILGKKDASSIVIDEIAGYLVSMFLLPQSWGFIVAGFFLFRFFDILKPWPLHRLQDIHGGPGVMLDDLGAGVYTNILLQLAAVFFSR